MTQLRKMMLEELQRRNYSPDYRKSYLQDCRRLRQVLSAGLRINSDRNRSGSIKLHLLNDRKLAHARSRQHIAALRFFF